MRKANCSCARGESSVKHPRPTVLVLASTFPRWSDDTEPRFVENLSYELVNEFDVIVLAPHCRGAARREILQLGDRELEVHRFRYCFEALETLGIEDETYVVFMSDDGAAGNRRRPNNTPLFAGKGTLYEGGIRVPLIISGPGVTVGYSATAVSGVDLFATFAAWAGADVASPESVDLTPLLNGRPEQFRRELALLFHYPHYGRGPLQRPQSAVIVDNWKLLKNWETGSYQLYDLASDLGEEKDLSSKEPDVHEELVALMSDRLQDVDAQFVSLNPEYRP